MATADHALKWSGKRCSPRAATVAQVLDDFHDAAAQADEDRYFAHFAPEGVFLGTDSSERWDVAAFRAYAHPHFANGKGWTYRATARHVQLAPDGDVAWFDKMDRGFITSRGRTGRYKATSPFESLQAVSHLGNAGRGAGLVQFLAWGA